MMEHQFDNQSCEVVYLAPAHQRFKIHIPWAGRLMRLFKTLKADKSCPCIIFCELFNILNK
jgi:hypothetical protein